MAVQNLYDFGIIIPVLADKDDLKDTLSALRLQPEEHRQRSICVIAVNANEKTLPENVENNRVLLSLAASGAPEYETGCGKTVWLDLTVKAKEGVGMARKKAVEAAEPFLKKDALICSLDADTIVENNYLPCIAAEFSGHPEWAGAAVKFSHRLPENPPAGLENAIKKYERYLASYTEGLYRAGSPYAYPVMGSAMVWRLAAGRKAGGMRVRAGGEDFYFLQALRKVGCIGVITSTVVHPLARCSDRVPFGTGPRLQEIMNGEFSAEPYPAAVFDLLQKLLDRADSEDPETFAVALMQVDDRITAWLTERDFQAVWEKILKNTPQDTEARRKAFHIWFDAFKTLKFIHSMTESLQ